MAIIVIVNLVLDKGKKIFYLDKLYNLFFPSFQSVVQQMKM